MQSFTNWRTLNPPVYLKVRRIKETQSEREREREKIVILYKGARRSHVLLASESLHTHAHHTGCLTYMRVYIASAICSGELLFSQLLLCMPLELAAKSFNPPSQTPMRVEFRRSGCRCIWRVSRGLCTSLSLSPSHSFSFWKGGCFAKKKRVHYVAERGGVYTLRVKIALVYNDLTISR